MGKTKGGFTLPGESGYEELTLQMAEKWGADVIRDSEMCIRDSLGQVLQDRFPGMGAVRGGQTHGEDKECA